MKLFGRKRNKEGGPTDLAERRDAVEVKKVGGTTTIKAGLTSAATIVRPLAEAGLNETIHPPARRRHHPLAGHPAVRAASRAASRARTRVRA